MAPAADGQAASAARTARVAVVGGGPAGLMAAEVLLEQGVEVDLFDAMPSVGRKFLLAGKGGLNLTHGEDFDRFVARYGPRASALRSMLEAFGPNALRQWAQGLGIDTFVGSSGRVFPVGMKAAPLLRAWLHRLRATGLRLHARHRWQGWRPSDPPTRLRLQHPGGVLVWEGDAVVLALGGASWARLGSDGAWWNWLAARGVPMAALAPANCGFDVGWSTHFSQQHAGAPMKTVRLVFDDGQGGVFDRIGEFVVTATGIEGSLVYAASSVLREAIARAGHADIHIDLLPGRSQEAIVQALAGGRGARSWPQVLKSRCGLQGVKLALLRERHDSADLVHLIDRAPAQLAAALKAWPIRLQAARPIDEAISTAGGVRFEGLDRLGMLTRLPGVFCAGEMLDWEAPTGGYLLTACFASGRAAGQGVIEWLRRPAHER